MKAQNEIYVRDLISLLGPNTLVKIIDDRTGEIEYSGIVVKLYKELPEGDATVVKHIAPLTKLDSAGRHIISIYVY